MGCCLCSPLPCPAPPQQFHTPASASSWQGAAAPPCPPCPAPGSLQPRQEKGGQGSIRAASAQTCPSCRRQWLPRSHPDRSPKGGSPRPSCPAYLSGAPAAGTATDSRARCLGGSQPAGTRRRLRGAAPGARLRPAAPAPPPGTHVPLEDAAGQHGAGPHHQVSADGEAAGAVALDEHDVGGLRLQHHHPRPLVHLIIRRSEPVTSVRSSAARVSIWDTGDPRTPSGHPTASHRHLPRLQGSGGAGCRYLPAARPTAGTSRRSAAMAATPPEPPGGPAPAATAPRRPGPGQRHRGSGFGAGLPGSPRGPPARGPEGLEGGDTHTPAASGPGRAPTCRAQVGAGAKPKAAGGGAGAARREEGVPLEPPRPRRPDPAAGRGCCAEGCGAGGERGAGGSPGGRERARVSAALLARPRWCPRAALGSARRPGSSCTPLRAAGASRG